MSHPTGRLVYGYFNAFKTGIVGGIAGCQVLAHADGRGCYVTRYEPNAGNATYMHYHENNYINGGESIIVPTFKSDENYTFLTLIKTGTRSPVPGVANRDFEFHATLAKELLEGVPVFVAPSRTVTFFRTTDNVDFIASLAIAEVMLPPS